MEVALSLTNKEKLGDASQPFLRLYFRPQKLRNVEWGFCLKSVLPTYHSPSSFYRNREGRGKRSVLVYIREKRKTIRALTSSIFFLNSSSHLLLFLFCEFPDSSLLFNLISYYLSRFRPIKQSFSSSSLFLHFFLYPPPPGPFSTIPSPYSHWPERKSQANDIQWESDFN